MAVSLTLNGWSVDYYPAGTSMGAAAADNIDVLEDRLLADHPRLRRIVARLLPGLPPLMFLLHWSDGSDLALVDAVVLAGRAADGDFSGSLVADIRSIECPHCGAVLRAAVADTGNPIFSQDRQRRLLEHMFVERCPVCNERSVPYVIEYLEPPPPPAAV
jgi:hypothetical protein